MEFLSEKHNWNYILIIFVLTLVAGALICFFNQRIELPFGALLSLGQINPTNNENKELNTPQDFRNEVIKVTRDLIDNRFKEKELKFPENLKMEGDWQLYVLFYRDGEKKERGFAESDELTSALKKAVQRLDENEKLTSQDVKNSRVMVRILRPPEDPFSFIEHNGEAEEVQDNNTIIRSLDKQLIRKRIDQGKEFLLRMENEKTHGFHKKYDAVEDSLKEKVHTVYTASIIYTFLYLNDLEQDREILKEIPEWSNFLLSMQNKNKGTNRYGAFHYSYYLDKQEKRKRFVVGTAGLSIFTLLRLHELTEDPKYLESAKLAGNWLIQMQNEDGSMKPYLEYEDGEWEYGDKESLLYNGQCLSALSKLYEATKNEKYYNAAKKLADRYAEKYEKEQGYIKGDYRDKNPISNSWVVMSLMDFYKATGEDYYKSIVFELSQKILKNQIDNKDNLLKHGRWKGAYSTSGNGWISEVMTETYLFCKKQGRKDCEQYKKAVIKVMRWITQNTYTEENSYTLKNPSRTLGGVFWNNDYRYVRTDSVCHALNGFIRMFNELPDKELISIPEKPLNKVLKELKR